MVQSKSAQHSLCCHHGKYISTGMAERLIYQPPPGCLQGYIFKLYCDLYSDNLNLFSGAKISIQIQLRLFAI